jgi:hypothetical protein
VVANDQWRPCGPFAESAVNAGSAHRQLSQPGDEFHEIDLPFCPGFQKHILQMRFYRRLGKAEKFSYLLLMPAFWTPIGSFFYVFVVFEWPCVRQFHLL